MNYKTPPTRFWENVQKDGPIPAHRPELGACWEWTAGTNQQSGRGYGQFTFYGRREVAHRVAYELTFGQIPEGLHVLHHCDNPPCVNPGHLWLGTHQQNMADMVAKGRNGKRRRTDRVLIFFTLPTNRPRADAEDAAEAVAQGDGTSMSTSQITALVVAA